MFKKTLLLVVLGVSFLWAGQKEAFWVEVAKAKKGNLSEYVYTMGKVVSDKAGYVYSPMPGILLRYTKDMGSFYKKDEAVAYVDRNIPGVKTEPLVIKAPFDGILAVKYANEGDMVAQSMPLCLFYSKSLSVDIDASSTLLNKIKKGTKCVIGKDLNLGEGYVSDISYGVDLRQGLGKIKVKLTKYKDLLPGEMVYVGIATSEFKNVVTVPLEAVVNRNGKSFVYLYDNGKAKEVEIEVLGKSGDKAAIKGQVKDNDTVITKGGMGLYDGAPVKIK